jgi:iron(III) transport system ATP-binding protein
MLDVRNVSKRFGSTVALDAVSLRLEAGEAALLRGPSGCGKTTLLRVIAGLAAPDSGEIRLSGSLASRPGFLIQPHRRNISFVFQEPRLWPHMTVWQNLDFVLSALKPDKRAARLSLAAENVGINGLLHRYPAELSVGQARRVALARALAPRRPLVLMDEPLTNLDEKGRQDLLEVIRRFWAEERFALLYVTHETVDDGLFIRRIIRMNNGRIEDSSGAGTRVLPVFP